MKKNSLYTFIITPLLGVSVSCSSPKSHNEDAPIQLLKNGELTASIFKISNKEYHIWTKNDLKNAEEVLFVRNGLKIEKEFVTYFYNDSTSDEGHYYAYYQTLYHRNELFEPTPNISSSKIASEYMTEEEAIKSKEKYETKKEKEYDSAYKRIIEFKDITFCKSMSDLKQFLSIIEETSNAICKGKESELRNKAKKSLFVFQKRNFPLARGLYHQNAKDKLWEKDIEVELSGKDITFVGYMFVKNQVIKDTYLEIRDEISKLRFRTIGFKAFDSDDRTYWKLDSKNDTEI